MGDAAQDPLSVLRRRYTAEHVQQAYERFDPHASLGLCSYLAEARGDKPELRHVPRYGHQQMRKASYFDLPEVLEALGGAHIGSTEYFWSIYDHDPLTNEPIVDQVGQSERLMMLAFMITWLEDEP